MVGHWAPLSDITMKWAAGTTEHHRAPVGIGHHRAVGSGGPGSGHPYQAPAGTRNPCQAAPGTGHPFRAPGIGHQTLGNTGQQASAGTIRQQTP